MSQNETGLLKIYLHTLLMGVPHAFLSKISQNFSQAPQQESILSLFSHFQKKIIKNISRFFRNISQNSKLE
ncbi:MAG: hypothetical protein D6805_02325 [Planctomycetota bacterium]|nr:MAG: hypothetical protein D6805_02325 [Planctomycetota bacterium]